MLCLKVPTDAAWARQALQDVDAVLVDHAHCEMKAASNALSLATRHLADAHTAQASSPSSRAKSWSTSSASSRSWSRAASPLGRRRSTRTRPSCGGARTRPTANRSDGAAMVDRLARFGALIEARSCERFKLLAEAAAEMPGDEALPSLWSELLAAEARHYRTFVDLAGARRGRRPRRRARAPRSSVADVEVCAIVRDLARRGEPGARASIHG